MSDYYNEDGVHEPERPPAPKRLRPRLPLIAVPVIALIGLIVFVGRGDDDGVARAPQPQPPSPSSPYEADAVAQGLAGAIANVVATVEDPNEGLPRIAAIGDNTRAVTGCTIVDTDVQAAPTKAKARAMVEEYKQRPGTGAAFQRVEYIESRREFVVIAISATCPGGEA